MNGEEAQNATEQTLRRLTRPQRRWRRERRVWLAGVFACVLLAAVLALIRLYVAGR